MAKIYKIALVSLFFSILPIVAQAATLYFSPSAGSYNVGSNLSVSINVSSADQAMNAASGVISFPQDKLEVVSLSKTGSIFTFWVQEPSFSNSVGTVTLEGIVLNPGFTGAVGKILTVNFRVKAAGTALLNFSSGSVLANDGKGTNILASLGSAQFSLGGAVPVIQELTTPLVASGAPSAPQISSLTHPDSDKWYPDSNPEFSWTLPSDVNGVSIYLSKSPTSNPGSVADGLFASKSYENVDDGIWYFHAKMKNSVGWGLITHFKIQIDTKPPESFAIKFIDGKETENPRPVVVFDTTDSLSGVNYYKIKIGEGNFFSVAPETVKTNPYILPLQSPGKHSILVQAYDKAGNYAVASEEFIIKETEKSVVAEKQSAFLKFGTTAASFLVLVIVLAALLIFFILIFWYGWRRLSSLKRRIKKETNEAEKALQIAFNLLKQNVRKQIKMLENAKVRRELTKEEEQIIKQLRQDLDEAEKFVRKEIKDIEKEVK